MKKGKVKSFASQSIIKGLTEALDYSENPDSSKVRTKLQILATSPVYKGRDIKRIRNKINLTQSLFAQTLGVSKKTVEAWEENRNIPQGPAQKMLFILDRKPNVIKSL